MGEKMKYKENGREKDGEDKDIWVYADTHVFQNNVIVRDREREKLCVRQEGTMSQLFVQV